MKFLSHFSWLLCAVIMVFVGYWSYRPGQQTGTEAVLSWDASGYYMYLPAIFVYHDLKELNFRDAVIRDYGPSPQFDQAFLHRQSGHYVMKYSAGLALQELPFFGVAHWLAPRLGYPADGFSEPYQLAIKIASILVAVLALALVRRALAPRFGEVATSLTLLLLVLGTNYLNYSALQGAMTHNWLFLWYAVLLLLTPAFYRQPKLTKALAIGGIIGLMTLTRPTEILAAIIPVLWGLHPTKAALQARLLFWRQHLRSLLGALLVGALVVSIQPLYWHYVSGDWVVYSYQEQGFSWLRPHLWDGIFSFRTGWLMYSPLLVLAIIGLSALRRQQAVAFWSILLYFLLFTYVPFAWDEWAYGGSLGQRAMVQSYAVLAWPMAAVLRWLQLRPWRLWLTVPLLVLGCYYNLWLTFSGMLAAGQMTRTYLWRVLFRYEVPAETLLLLDSNSEFTGIPRNKRTLWQEDFESQDATACGTPPLAGRCSLRLHAGFTHSAEYRIAARPGDFQWVRASADARADSKEWDLGHMTQYVVRFQLGDKIVKERTVHFQRALEANWPRNLHFYMRPPQEPFDKVVVTFLYFGSTANLVLDNARLEAFDE